ncbi:MAG: hypothetical protein ACPLPG_07080 [Thermotoga caldifontis]|uniref:hypothetical protein n=1 Tax=Thermotoga caldifontis TaxID=1508419 RepID=UPI003C7CFAD6
MSRRTFWAVLAILFSICSLEASSIELRNQLATCEKDCVLNVPLQSILKDVSLLALGCNQNIEIARDVAYAAGMVARSYGFEYVVFGTLGVLVENDPDPLCRISRSPFITAQVLSYMIEGFISAGIVPIINATGNVNADVVRSLLNRKMSSPALVENEQKANQLRELGFNVVFVTLDGQVFGRLPRLNVKPPTNLQEVERIRRKALEGAIVLLNRSINRIAVNNPFERAGVLVFSDEEWILNLAQQVLRGERPSTGRIP